MQPSELGQRGENDFVQASKRQQVDLNRWSNQLSCPKSCGVRWQYEYYLHDQGTVKRQLIICNCVCYYSIVCVITQLSSACYDNCLTHSSTKLIDLLPK